MGSRERRLAAQEVGDRGEEAVAEWYRRAGFEVVGRNWRCREGELDVIASNGTTVVFCEVKSRSSSAFADPRLAVDHRKQAKVRRAALRWLDSQRWHRHLRFDVATVVGSDITVIEDAF